MTNNSDLKAAAEALRNHAWLARFRKANYKNGYHVLSPSCAHQVAEYVDDFIGVVLATQQQDGGEAEKTDVPTIQNVRDELRSAMNMMLLMATANQITGKLDRVNWIHDTVRNMAAFGANCKLISMEEHGDWCIAMAGTISVADVLQKWDKPFREITARKEQPAHDAAITEELVVMFDKIIDGAEVDFLGTGSNSKLAAQKEVAWRADANAFRGRLLDSLGVPTKKDKEVPNG